MEEVSVLWVNGWIHLDKTTIKRICRYSTNEKYLVINLVISLLTIRLKYENEKIFRSCRNYYLMVNYLFWKLL